MNEEKYIKISLEEARKASWPFGAVVVRNGEIISQAGSGDDQDEITDPTAHAEVNAIRRACTKLKTGDLSGATLYASCEPCALCVGAAWYANIKDIVYGTSLEDVGEINKAWGGDLGFPHNHLKETGINMRGGLLKEEIMEMYKKHPRVTR
ncbi:MAG: nucleoside deaminase [Candidatus Paceibacterota bacterium]